MQTQTLYRLGALDLILVALGLTVLNLLYFVGVPFQTSTIFLDLALAVLQILGIMTLYVVQARAGGPILLLGFIVLIVGMVLIVAQQAQQMGLTTGVLTQAQMDQASQLPPFQLLDTLSNAYALGTIIFGFATYRAGVLSRWAALALIAVGITSVLSFIEPIAYLFAVVSLIAFAWLGFSVWQAPMAALELSPGSSLNIPDPSPYLVTRVTSQ